MNDDIGHPMDVSFDLALNGVGEVMGSMQMHFRIDEDVEVNVDIVRASPAPNPMALHDTCRRKTQLLNLLDGNRNVIAQYA